MNNLHICASNRTNADHLLLLLCNLPSTTNEQQRTKILRFGKGMAFIHANVYAFCLAIVSRHLCEYCCFGGCNEYIHYYELFVIDSSIMNVEEVKQKIIAGDYLLKMHEQQGRIGRYYRIMDDGFDKKANKLVPYFFHCRVCGSVVNQVRIGGTGKLNRHADACDPPSASIKESASNDSKDDDEDDTTGNFHQLPHM